MHEMALAQELVAILERLAREHGAPRIASATLEIGGLTCVDPETLEFAFQVVSRGTVAERSTLFCRRIPVVLACPSCGREGPSDGELAGCPGCGSPARVVSGRDMRVVSIDVEDPPDA